MSKAMVGDFHRFGKCVRQNGPRFLKPRSGYLEFLFFDPSSPLSVFLDRLLPDRIDFKISCTQTWECEAEDISIWKVGNPPANLARTAAHWAYLALQFGLTDLHCGNVFVTRRGLQPVDLELAFEPVTNLVETGLINHPSTPPSRAGFFGQLGPYSIDGVNLVDEFLSQVSRGNELAKPLGDRLWEEMEKQPVRRILRSTEEYRAALASGSFDRFWPEEVLQLKVGDIPYFFNVHPDPQIFYFSTPDHIEPVVSPMEFRSKLSADAISSSERMVNMKKVVVLQLVRRFWPNGKVEIRGKHFSAEKVGNGSLMLIGPDFKIQTPPKQS